MPLQDELNANIIKMKDSIEIQPLLLNPNDSFTLNVLLNNYDERLHVTARIEGVKSIGLYKKSKFTIVNTLDLLQKYQFIDFH